MQPATCARVYRRNAVATLSPGRLILMLFDGALRFIGNAKTALGNESGAHRHETVHNQLVKAQAVLDELAASLDPSHDSEFADRMAALYDFMHGQLERANITKSAEPIDVVAELLGGIRESWAEMLATADLTSLE